jgi:sugar transferase (PEP-CTERM/EpsH1 system associated)
MSAPPALICHIIHQLAVGGLENGVVNLINHLPGDHYRHAVICITNATEFRNRIQPRNVEIYEIHKLPGKDVAAYGRMWRLLRRLKPQIVHTRNLPALDMLAPAWLAGVPRLVHSEHGLDMRELAGTNRRYNRLRQLSRLAVDRYVTVSRDLHDWLHCDIGIPESRLAVIYNGVDTDRFTPEGASRKVLPAGFAPQGTVVLGTLGRFEAVKNQLGLAHAFLRVLERRPALRQVLRLVLIGDGSQRSAIEQALAEGQAGDLAWMPGFRDDAPDLYRALDIFVLPSLREGISNTILEAMASGRAVIATRVGGNPEILPEDVAGRLVAPNDPDALAAAILDYIDRPALIRAHGEAGRAAVLAKFSLATMVENYDRLYRAQL